MSATTKSTEAQLSPERAELLRRARENDRLAGITGPVVPVAELRASQIARGIVPEHNIGSRELMAMRYGDDWDAD